MSFDWNEYLVLAKALGAQDAEGSKRSAISRAYYAAFHAALSYLESLGVRFPKDKDKHEQVWLNLQNGSGSRPRSATRGRGLRSKRNTADYDEREYAALDAETAKAIKDAEDIIADVKVA